MALFVTRNVMGREQRLYVKIEGLVGNKNNTSIKVAYYWDREVSLFPENAIFNENFTMHFDRNASGNPFAIAYGFVKEQFDLMGYTYENVDSPDEEPLTTKVPEDANNPVIATSE